MHPDTILRFTLACMVGDTRAGLAPHQRAWLRAWMIDPVHTFSPAQRAKLIPVALAWADARHCTLGVALRRGLAIPTEPAVPGMSGLDILARYPGLAAREQAEQLRETAEGLR